MFHKMLYEQSDPLPSYLTELYYKCKWTKLLEPCVISISDHIHIWNENEL